MIGKHEIEIGSVYFFENYIISEVKEGAIITFESTQKLYELTKKYYGNKTPFVYISNRINSYSFEPTAHIKSKTIFPNLKGLAVVIYDPLKNEIAQLEKKFLNHVENGIFYNLEEAVQWAKKIIPND
ncbi:hypothetical protein [Aquimarina pacifica]|uniref:hypothetical protein n=1 Tax=Aquimarina pacifica TaxID=1296415 RepID=UPI00046E9A76|nr:hypothetical protein [Aquimarina pacifica]